VKDKILVLAMGIAAFFALMTGLIILFDAVNKRANPALKPCVEADAPNSGGPPFCAIAEARLNVPHEEAGAPPESSTEARGENSGTYSELLEKAQNEEYFTRKEAATFMFAHLLEVGFDGDYVEFAKDFLVPQSLSEAVVDEEKLKTLADIVERLHKRVLEERTREMEFIELNCSGPNVSPTERLQALTKSTKKLEASFANYVIAYEADIFPILGWPDGNLSYFSKDALSRFESFGTTSKR
jgi:hypothetical protein